MVKTCREIFEINVAFNFMLMLFFNLLQSFNIYFFLCIKSFIICISILDKLIVIRHYYWMLIEKIMKLLGV